MKAVLPLALASGAVALLGMTLGIAWTALLLITAWLVFATANGALFKIEGYVGITALYYWLGVANPLHADVHGITLTRSTVNNLGVLIGLGLLLVWLGALAARRVLHQPVLVAVESPSEAPLDPQFLRRLHFTAWGFLAAGVAVALICYLRLGVPALAPAPDLARTEFVGRLSPFTYYQWLFIEVGVGVSAITIAQDRSPGRRRGRSALAVGCLLSLLVVSGVFSRVAVGTPFVIAAVAWWSQGRRIPRLAILLGIASVVFLIAVVWLLRLQAVGPITLYGVDIDLQGGPTHAARAIIAGLTIFARTSVEAFGLFIQGELPHLHGEVSFMSLISLLPGRHPGLGLFHISQLLGYDPQQGTTVSLFGGMYADFGVPGIILSAPLIGGALGGLECTATKSDRLNGLYYAVVFSYYLNMIYGGQLVDATLIWKLFLAVLAIRYCRTGRLLTSRVATLQVIATACLYVYGLLRLAAL